MVVLADSCLVDFAQPAAVYCDCPHREYLKVTMTAPALNASISIKEKINGLSNGHSHSAELDTVKSNVINGAHGVNGVNGVNGHKSSPDHSAASIVKEAPFNTGRGRPLRVVCIGAGAAGIYLGLKLPRTISPDLCELQVSCSVLAILKPCLLK